MPFLPMPRRFMRLRSCLPLVGVLVAGAGASGCDRGEGVAGRSLVPPASFLLMAGDSTFWVESDPSGVHVRRSPLFLTEIDGAFHELYVTDVDRSYFDALIVGQHVYRRDLVTGDSVLLVADSALAVIASDFAMMHPGERPLAADEDGTADPETQASTETTLVEALGPYLTYEEHRDIDVAGGRTEHATVRGVVDVRTGRAVGIAELAGADVARRLHAEGRRLLGVALDSIRRSGDERGRRARSAIAGFAFDSLSFTLLEDGGAPAVAFLVPGRGDVAGGYALPLPPLPFPAGPWFDAARALLPESRAEGFVWSAPFVEGAPGGGYEVVAREDSIGEWASVAVRVGGASWPVARVPLPVRRLHRLEATPNDAESRRALSRAFDESALYSGEARTARGGRPSAPSRPPLIVASTRRYFPAVATRSAATRSVRSPSSGRMGGRTQESTTSQERRHAKGRVG